MRRLRAIHAVSDAWRVAPHPSCARIQKRWLKRGGSLTAHLRELGAVTVRVTRERLGRAWRDEVTTLRVSARSPVWVREVVLEVDGAPFIVARSVIPLAASRGVWRPVRRLAARPLAELLYQDKKVARSALASTKLGARHPLAALVKRDIDQPPLSALLARRSLFQRRGARLLVTECMLPALWIHARAHARAHDGSA